MEESIHVDPILGHLLLNIALLGDAVPELARGASTGNSAGHADDDGRVVDGSIDAGSHCDQSTAETGDLNKGSDWDNEGRESSC